MTAAGELAGNRTQRHPAPANPFGLGHNAGIASGERFPAD
jgi:hypothetical protein